MEGLSLSAYARGTGPAAGFGWRIQVQEAVVKLQARAIPRTSPRRLASRAERVAAKFVTAVVAVLWILSNSSLRRRTAVLS